ncbi:MAG: RNA polymerase sporulation sigma factor SigK [Eubacteriales bacterium]
MITDFLAMLIGGLSYLVLNVSSGQKFPPPLSAEEESALFHRMREEKAEDARSKLIEHNLRLVAHIVRKYYASQLGQDDLISIGTIGLIKAIDSYDIRNGARFATYASKCIQNEILMYFRAQKKTMCEVSINETIDTDRDGNPLTYIDIIKIDDTIADDIDEKWKITQAIRFIKENLSERERRILVMRYGLGNAPPVTQREVAQALGISRSYVSRIEKNVLDRLSRFLEGKEEA